MKRLLQFIVLVYMLSNKDKVKEVLDILNTLIITAPPS